MLGNPSVQHVWDIAVEDTSTPHSLSNAINCSKSTLVTRGIKFSLLRIFKYHNSYAILIMLYFIIDSFVFGIVTGARQAA